MTLPTTGTIQIVAVVTLSGVTAAYVLCVALDWRTRNWEGRAIPSSVGLGFLPAVWAVAFLSPPAGDVLTHPFACLVTVFGWLGLLDDRYGSRDATGLTGHLRALLHGTVTTGTVKLLGGGAAALLMGFALRPDRPFEAVVSALVMALSANLINLLDCRPSRALKGTWLLAGTTFAAGVNAPALIAITVASVVYAPLDFRCRAMMGDAGSNALGAALGFCWAANASLSVLCALLALLVGVHVFTERFSLTAIIEGQTALRWGDRLGVASVAQPAASGPAHLTVPPRQ